MNSLAYFDRNQAGTLLSTILAGSSEALVCQARNGRVVAVNQRFLDLVGWAGPYAGQPLAELWASWKAEVPHPRVIEDYLARCQSGSGSEDPVEVHTHPGRVTEARFTTWTDPDGQAFDLWYFQEWRTSALAWVSHEIKNPLNAVLGFTELLTESLEGEFVSDAVRESLRGLKLGARHLNSVLGDLLDLSRLESGVVEPHPEWVSLKTFLDETADLYRTRFQRRGLEFQVQHPAGPAVQVWTDPRRLSQILGNLLSNALRFTKRGWVTLKVVHDGAKWTFLVEDSGVGIPGDQQNLIFEPFVQKHGQDQRRFGGTGLGLAICRTLAQGLGAHLGLESEVGVGSRFSVVFDSLDHRVEPGPQAKGPKASLTLLVADDEPSNHLLVKGYLRDSPVTVVTASSGSQAFELWKEHRPKAVLLDLRMPGLSGIEVARRIRAFDFERKTTILTMSASPPSPAEAAEGRNLWSGFVEKPFGKQDLLKFLSKHLTFVDEFVGSP
jgi:signal transduction histidine kinase/ActR/RegA family two-component response regulator